VIQVTIVGAGHYARSIVARNYHECPRCTLKGVISPHASAERLVGTPLAGVPLVQDADQWRRLHGTPNDHDVFDLCVHPDAIMPAMRPLVACGARSFVLPKPLATTREALEAITAIAAGLRVAVASQWHYSQVTAGLRDAVAGMTGPLRIEATFSQRFDPGQLRFYTPYTALLPHMLQILHSTGLWQPDGRDRITRTESTTRLAVEIASAQADTHIGLVTDLDAATRQRVVRVTDATGRRIEADFLGVFTAGIAEKLPAIVIDGHREEIAEDNIAVMVRHTIAGMLDGSSYLDLDAYRPVNEMLLALSDT